MSDAYVRTSGLAFVEFSGNNPLLLEAVLDNLGFAKTGQHADRPVDAHTQGDIRFISNSTLRGHAAQFRDAHGQGVSALGFRVEDASQAHVQAISLGGFNAECRDYDIPALQGVGESLIYLLDAGCEERLWTHLNCKRPSDRGAGLVTVDHLTHILERGNLAKWQAFYETVFGFKKLHSFHSVAMSSPCGKIMITLNESLDERTQTQEFIDRFQGEGIQHITLTSSDIYRSVRTLRNNGVVFQEMPDSYYNKVDDRLPGHGENVAALRDLNILIDGNEKQDGGILLQIFTKESIDPICFEFIQRKGNQGFGEGNFQARLESMELDQINRGVIEV